VVKLSARLENRSIPGFPCSKKDKKEEKTRKGGERAGGRARAQKKHSDLRSPRKPNSRKKKFSEEPQA